MKLEIQTERTCEKDLKKLKKRGKDLSKLKVVIKILISGGSLPEKYRNHKLSGNFRGCWECHIEPDWLLIYKKASKILILVRSGTHSDLF